MTRNLITISLVLLGILTFNACSKKEEPSGQAKQLSATEIPAGALFAAADLDGKVHPSSEWLGKQPMVINFWGTWCPPCRREIPDLVRVYDEYRSQGVALVSLAVNDEVANVRAYTAEHGMNWVQLIAEPQDMSAFGEIRGVPTTIFFDRNGKEVKRFVGAQSYDDFKQAFQMILAI